MALERCLRVLIVATLLVQSVEVFELVNSLSIERIQPINIALYWCSYSRLVRIDFVMRRPLPLHACKGTLPC